MDRSGGHELGPGAAHRLYQGRNPGQSFEFFFEKIEKSEKIKILINLIENLSLNQTNCLIFNKLLFEVTRRAG